MGSNIMQASILCSPKQKGLFVQSKKGILNVPEEYHEVMHEHVNDSHYHLKQNYLFVFKKIWKNSCNIWIIWLISILWIMIRALNILNEVVLFVWWDILYTPCFLVSFCVFMNIYIYIYLFLFLFFSQKRILQFLYIAYYLSIKKNEK